jgi:L-2-hydroxyglutarate oxidase LhgO
MKGIRVVDQVDCVVIGAGVVGLAVARSLALARREVVVLEAAHDIGTGISSRNSEVIHAGIYYAQNSLKARLCVVGKHMLYAYCQARHIGHRRCGKLIVANGRAQVTQLRQMAQGAQTNGVDDLVLLDSAAASVLEHHLACDAALLSPSTGIVDSHALMLALQVDLERAGCLVVMRCALMQANFGPQTVELTTHDGTHLSCKTLVNAAGLQATALARSFTGLGVHPVPQTFYAKRNYFSLVGQSPFSRLVYPVPESAGLGAPDN